MAKRSTDEQIMEVFTLAAAPLGADTLLGDVTELSTDDITPELVLDEAEFVTKMQTEGFERFHSFFEKFRDDDPTSASQEAAAGIHVFAAYLKRMRGLNGALLDMVEQLAVQYGECSGAVAAFGDAARVDNRRPQERAAFDGLVDLTPNARWATVGPVQSRSATGGPAGKVGFKETTQVRSDKGDEAEEQLKVSEIKRKKQRNATGYQKFTFRDLGLSEADLQFSDDLAAAATSGPISTSASSTAGRDSRTSSEGGESFSASVADEVRQQEESNPFASGLGRSGSVNFSFDKEREEIKDKEADPHWAEMERQRKRFSRIRNRVPTGHPSMIKKSSDELKQLVKDLEEAALTDIAPLDPAAAARGDLGTFDKQTARNTLANQRAVTAISPEEEERSPL